MEHSRLPLRRDSGDDRLWANEDVANVASVHANVHNHFSPERHLTDRQTYKERRSAALPAWQVLAS